MYEIGYRVKLRSGKTGVIASKLGTEGYVVTLDDGAGRVRVPSYDVMGVVGTQCLDGGAGRKVFFTPTFEEKLSAAAVRVVQVAYTDAVDRLIRCKVAMSQDLLTLDNAAPASMRLQMAAFICFNLPFGSKNVEYKNLMQYCRQVVDGVFRGITKDRFVICEVGKTNMKLANGQLVAGYVPTFGLETLSMYLYGSSAHQYFKQSCPLSGEVHVNVHDFIKNSWQICQTLIHEATHKFCRTIDVHYLGAGAVSIMKTFITLQAGGIPMTVSQIEKAIHVSDNELASKRPQDLLNNADSFAYFVMLMTE